MNLVFIPLVPHLCGYRTLCIFLPCSCHLAKLKFTGVYHPPHPNTHGPLIRGFHPTHPRSCSWLASILCKRLLCKERLFFLSLQDRSRQWDPRLIAARGLLLSPPVEFLFGWWKGGVEAKILSPLLLFNTTKRSLASWKAGCYRENMSKGKERHSKKVEWKENLSTKWATCCWDHMVGWTNRGIGRCESRNLEKWAGGSTGFIYCLYNL